MSTNKPTTSITAHSAYVNCLASADSDRTLITCSQDRSIKVWDLTTGQLKHKWDNSKTDHQGSVRALCMAAPCVLASGGQDKTIRIWDLTSGRQIRTLVGHADTVSCLGKLAHGELVSGSFDKNVRVWEWQSGECVRLGQQDGAHTDYIATLITLPNDMIVTGSWDKTVKRWRRV